MLVDELEVVDVMWQPWLGTCPLYVLSSRHRPFSEFCVARNITIQAYRKVQCWEQTAVFIAKCIEWMEHDSINTVT